MEIMLMLNNSLCTYAKSFRVQSQPQLEQVPRSKLKSDFVVGLDNAQGSLWLRQLNNSHFSPSHDNNINFQCLSLFLNEALIALRDLITAISPAFLVQLSRFFIRN